MSNPPSRTNSTSASRRGFLKSSGTAALAGALGTQLSIARSAHAAGSDLLKLGLVGCGGRGNGAAAQALLADPNTQLVALADVFEDQIERSAKLLTGHKEVGSRVDVPKDRQFVGFDAYKQLIASDVDVVLLGAPPHFRPAHLEACIDAGKHVFAEKPVAVDAPGVRRVLEACRKAKEKNLAVASGLCWRYNYTARSSIAQVHEGAVGDLVAIESTYNASRPGKPYPLVREDGWSDMEFQLRNWYWFTWLSGDHIVEQAVHSIDKACWALRDEPPLTAVGMGGQQTRLDEPTGNIFDHHAVTFEYANGVKVFHCCRQQPGTAGDVSTHVMGTNGTCVVEKGEISGRDGKRLWRYRGDTNVMHQTEHDELFANLRKGKITNDGLFMTYSTMVAIMGRMATYTGQKITWDSALASTEDLSPPEYKWGQLAMPTEAMPGITRFL